MASIPYPWNQTYIPQTSPEPQLIVKPTLEQIARHGNNFPEPMVDGGFDDYEPNSYLNQSLGGAAAVGLLAAASKVNHSRRTFLEVLGLTAAGAGLSSCAAGFAGGGTTTHESPNFRFYLPNNLSKAAIDYIIEEHELGLKKLEERLHIERDFGLKLGGKLSLEIGSGEPDRAWLFGSKAGTTTLSRGFVEQANWLTKADDKASAAPILRADCFEILPSSSRRKLLILFRPEA